MRCSFMRCLLLFAIFPFFGGVFAKEAKGDFAQTNGIDIWYETFGKKEDPALLLIMGAGAQGIFWPAEFCQKLAQRGFYVIRYDHRDCGMSSCFDFKKDPYDLNDLSKDAIGLLDFLKIEKAHLFGLSMGGPIAEILSVQFPDRILSVALAASSLDLEPCSRAHEGLPSKKGSLPPPSSVYLDWMKGIVPPTTEEEQLEMGLSAWRILNGSRISLDEVQCKAMQQEFLHRNRHPESQGNHMLAIKRSLELIRTIPYQVKAPSVVFHGTEDPILPPEHGQALAAAIQGAKYILMEGFGHVPNAHFYQLLIDEITENSNRR